MDPTFVSLNSFDSISSIPSENDDLNAYFSDLLSQQWYSVSAPHTNYGGFGVDGLFLANRDFTSAGSSFCDGLPTDITWQEPFLLTEGLPLDVPLGFDTCAGFTPGLSNMNMSGTPLTCIPGVGSALFNVPVGLPALNLGVGNTGMIMPGAPPSFDLTAASANVNIPVSSQISDLSTEITGIDMPVGLHIINQHPSYPGCGNGGPPNGTNSGDPIGNDSIGMQPVGGAYAPLNLPNNYLDICAAPEIQSLERAVPPTAPPPTPEWQPSPATTRNASSNTSPDLRTPLKRRRSSQSLPRPPPKRRKDWPKGSEAPIRFVHDELSMPPNFRANPDNHGRFQYTATGRRRYLNAPKAVQERRRRREGNRDVDEGNGGL